MSDTPPSITADLLAAPDAARASASEPRPVAQDRAREDEYIHRMNAVFAAPGGERFRRAYAVFERAVIEAAESGSGYLPLLPEIVAEDVRALVSAQRSYGDSWIQRGGTGAFFVMIRKADRMENAVKRFGYDILAALADDRRSEGLIDDIRDLRRYLALIEAEAYRRGIAAPPLNKGD